MNLCYIPTASELFAGGFGSELIEVSPPTAQLAPGSKIDPKSLGKVPARRLSSGLYVGYDWRTASSSASDVAKWSSAGSSTGLRADLFPSLDVDVLDAGLSALISDFATIQLGQAPKRVGRAPKCLRLFRLAGEPFNRMRLHIRKDGAAHLCEWLSRGQQMVVAGVHASTGNAYSWDVPSLSAADLPTIDRESASAFFDDLESMLTARGYTVEREGSGVASLPPADQSSLVAPSIELLRDAVSRVPNTGDRAEYIRWGNAIHAACGAETDAGFAIFSDFADRWTDGVNAPETVERDWRSFTWPHVVGWRYIADNARAFGFAEDSPFDAILPAPVVEAAEPAHASEGETMAALLRDASVPFLLAAARKLEQGSVGDMRALWETLERAANGRRGPLAKVWAGVVLPASSRVGKGHAPPMFSELLASELRHDAAWKSLEDADRDLLTRTVYYGRFSRPSLNARTSLGRPVSAEDVTRATSGQIVAGSLPLHGVLGIVGASTAGKSFLALDLALRVAREANDLTGEPDAAAWMNRAVASGSVVYLASEDALGNYARAAEWQKVHGAAPHLVIFSAVPNLLDLSATVSALRDAVAHTATPVALIVVDVLRASLGSADENDAGTMSVALDNLRVAASIFDCAAVAVHHAGHAAADRARGSSAFRGALDAEIVVTRKPDNTISVLETKVKNGPHGAVREYHLNDAGVLVDGRVERVRDADADVPDDVVLDTVMQRIALHMSVSPAQILSALAAESPARFCAPEVARTTAQSRRDAALNIALGRHWIVKERTREKYGIGPKSPAALERAAVVADFPELADSEVLV